MNCRELITFLETEVPLETAEGWDNPGFLVALINDPGVVEDVMEKAGEVFDPSEFTHVEAMMLGEDFANYLEEMDGCFAFIGGGDHPANHHGKFDFDEKALISGVRLMLTFVIV